MKALLVFNNQEMAESIRKALNSAGVYHTTVSDIQNCAQHLKDFYQLILTDSSLYSLNNRMAHQQLMNYIKHTSQVSLAVIITPGIPILPEMDIKGALYQQIYMNEEMFFHIRSFALHALKLQEVISIYQDCKIAHKRESKFWLAFLLVLFGLFSFSIFTS